MSVLKRLSQWWQGAADRGAPEPALPQDPLPAPEESTRASARQAEPDGELDRLMAAYRKERGAQMISTSDSSVEQALDDLRDFYVTTGRDLAQLNGFVAQVDEDLLSQYAAG